jgi:hypothetical protein
MDQALSGFIPIPLKMTDQSGAVIQDAKQQRLRPLAITPDDLSGECDHAI